MNENPIDHYVFGILITMVVFVLMKLIIPDVPKKYQTLKKRHDFIAKKALSGLPLQDDNEMELLPERTVYGLF